MKLKGHTTIELTNVETGEKKVYNDDNVVTNFFDAMFQQNGILNFNIFEMFYDSGRKPKGDQYLSDSVIKELTGGLMLFESSIDEDTSNIWPRSDNVLIGQGCDVAYNGSLSTVGSYNNSESGLSEDGNSYKHVWDFTTSQANGQISCACLTSKVGGKIGGGSKEQMSSDYLGSLNIYSTGRHSKTTYISDCCVNNGGVLADYDNNCLYQVFGIPDLHKYLSKSEEPFSIILSKSITVRKVKVPFNKINIFDRSGVSDREIIEEFTIPFPDELFEKIQNYDEVFDSGSYNYDVPSCWNVYGTHLYLYIHFADILPSTRTTKRVLSPTSEMYIIDFDLVSKTSSLLTAKNMTGKNFSSWSGESYWMTEHKGQGATQYTQEYYCWGDFSQSQRRPMYVTDKYIILFPDDGKLYVMSRTDNTNIKVVTEDDGSEFKLAADSDNQRTNFSFCPLGKSVEEYNKNKLLFKYADSSHPYVYCLDLENAKVTRAATTSLDGFDDIQFIGSDLSLRWYSSGLTCGILPMYLATINNLDTPVEKTSAETMKVTYTLTKA